MQSKVIEWIINIVFAVGGKWIKGYRTIIISILMALIGAWEWITGSGLYGFLCSLGEKIQFLAFFCNVESTKFYGVLVTIFGVLSYMLRKLTDTPAGDSGVAEFAAINPIKRRALAIGAGATALIVIVVVSMVISSL